MLVVFPELCLHGRCNRRTDRLTCKGVWVKLVAWHVSRLFLKDFVCGSVAVRTGRSTTAGSGSIRCFDICIWNFIRCFDICIWNFIWIGHCFQKDRFFFSSVVFFDCDFCMRAIFSSKVRVWNNPCGGLHPLWVSHTRLRRCGSAGFGAPVSHSFSALKKVFLQGTGSVAVTVSSRKSSMRLQDEESANRQSYTCGGKPARSCKGWGTAFRL